MVPRGYVLVVFNITVLTSHTWRQHGNAFHIPGPLWREEWITLAGVIIQWILFLSGITDGFVSLKLFLTIPMMFSSLWCSIMNIIEVDNEKFRHSSHSSCQWRLLSRIQNTWRQLPITHPRLNLSNVSRAMTSIKCTCYLLLLAIAESPAPKHF